MEAGLENLSPQFCSGCQAVCPGLVSILQVSRIMTTRTVLTLQGLYRLFLTLLLKL
jgi:hypothetical protein